MAALILGPAGLVQFHWHGLVQIPAAAKSGREKNPSRAISDNTTLVGIKRADWEM